MLDVKNSVRQVYKDVLDRQPDAGGLEFYSQAIGSGVMHVADLYTVLRSSEEYKKKFVYLQIDKHITNKFKGNIVYCQSTFYGDVDSAIANVNAARFFGDRIECVVVYDETIHLDDIVRLRNSGAMCYHHPWQDNLPLQRNNCVQHARELGAQWVISSDPDEHFRSKFWDDIRRIIGSAESFGYDLLQINKHDVHSDTNEKVSTEGFKDLIFRMRPEVKFVGHGNLPIWHEGVVGLTNAIRLPREYYYEHVRSRAVVLEHSTKDMYISGGGPSLGGENPTWVALKNITDRLNIKSWYEYINYLRKGNINSELKQFFIDHKDDNFKDGDQNMRDTYTYYFGVLHPEEA